MVHEPLPTNINMISELVVCESFNKICNDLDAELKCDMSQTMRCDVSSDDFINLRTLVNVKDVEYEFYRQSIIELNKGNKNDQ